MVTVSILFLASLVQGVVGFALALVAIPALVWLGHPVPEAIGLSAASTLIQALTGMAKLWRSIPWRTVAEATVLRLLMLPVGVYILTRVHALDADGVRAFLGICVVVMVMLQIFGRVRPKAVFPSGVKALAFASSGLFAGMVGMGGPPLVLWLSVQQWTSERARAFLFANFALLAPVNLLLLAGAFGSPVILAMQRGLLMAPVVIAGSILGVALGSRLPRETFRWVLLAMLLLMGIASVLSALR